MGLRILIAPACFKGSLSAMEAAGVMNDFLAERLRADPVELCLCPIADGGDDTLAVLQAANPDFRAESCPVTGPLPEMTVNARYLFNAAQKLVWIEAAQAHGLKLMPKNAALAPMQATSFGVGQLMRHALQAHQPETLVVSVGGSASTDGGMGMLQALGACFLDKAGRDITAPLGGGDLAKLGRMVWPGDAAAFGWKRLIIATDVVNPLLGPQGAAKVFGPQKGATSLQCQQLDDGLAHLAQMMQVTSIAQGEFGEAQMGIDSLSSLPGTGAAGGLAFGLRCLPRSGIVSGSQWIAEPLHLPQRVAQSQVILTGEGCLDLTSLGGKATGHLLAMAGDKPVLFFCGQARDGLSGWGNVSVFPMVLMDAHSQQETGLLNTSQQAESGYTQAIASAMADPKAALRRVLEQAWPQLESLISAG